MQQAINMMIAAPPASMRAQAFVAGNKAAMSRGRPMLPSRKSNRMVLVRAEASGESEEDFEVRLAALKRAKGETPYGEGVKKGVDLSASSKSSAPAPKKNYDYSQETLHFESGPAAGDVAVNLALGITLLWLPLSIAAVGRAAFLKYRFTDRRISVITTAPWKNEQVDAAYQEVKDVVTIGRGIGLWGDMLVTLKDGSKIEMRALPQFLELKEYILKRRDELTGGSGSNGATPTSPDAGKGFA